MPLLFSYGTLQLEQVQIETFGRKLKGTKETLNGYKLYHIEITDPEVLRKSNQKYHPSLRFTGDPNDTVEGILFMITEKELLQADAYEVEAYKRIELGFVSGKKGFLYVEK